MSEGTVRALREFAERGGRVVLLGNECMSRDEYGRERKGEMNWGRMIRLGDTRQFTNSRKLFEELRPRLQEWQLWCPVQATDSEGSPVWGVEYLAAKMSDGRLIVNLVNYRSQPQTVRLLIEGKSVRCNDLLTGTEARADGTVLLQPLDPCLMQTP